MGLCADILLVDVAAYTTSVHPFWSKETSIAWLVAVWLAIMLCVAASGQGLAAPLTAETGPMPVLPQGRHLLSKVDLLVTPGTQVGLTREGSDAGSFDRSPGCQRCLLLRFGGGVHVSRSRVIVEGGFIHIGPCSTDVYTFWSEEGSIAWFVAEGLPIVLSMSSCVQGFVTAATLQTEFMPVLPQ